MTMTERWWVINEVDLLRALREAAVGETTPEIILLELTANSDSEHVDGS